MADDNQGMIDDVNLEDQSAASLSNLQTLLGESDQMGRCVYCSTTI